MRPSPVCLNLYLFDRKYYFILFFFALVQSNSIKGQQSSQFSQYILNPVMINPAITGAESYGDITAIYRNQWTGFEGAPRTASATFNAPYYTLFGGSSRAEEESHSGLGAMIYEDEAGPITRSGYYASYAYHLKVSPQWFVSLGTFVGFNQFAFDNSNVEFVQSDFDPLNQSISSSNFDLSLGMFAYSKSMFLGISANQLIEDELLFDTSNNTTEERGVITTNYNFLLGGRQAINDVWQIVPSILFKTERDSPLQWDLNVKTTYNDSFWTGASYRNEESFLVLVGTRILRDFSISYSYDIPFSKISGYQSGTHEIVLSYRFSNDHSRKCHCPRYAM